MPKMKPITRTNKQNTLQNGLSFIHPGIQTHFIFWSKKPTPLFVVGREVRCYGGELVGFNDALFICAF